MGNFSNRQMDDDNERFDKNLAKHWGISNDEYERLHGHFHLNEKNGNDGEIYGYHHEFTQEAPSDILQKIRGYNPTSRSVDISGNELDGLTRTTD